MRYVLVALISALVLLLAACGNETSDDSNMANEPDPTPTEEIAETPAPGPTEAESAASDPTATPEPAATPTPETEATSEPEAPDLTPTTQPEPEPEPAEDVDLAPELAGLTDWRNIEPTTLEELRGQPVVLVFWNSI